MSEEREKIAKSTNSMKSLREHQEIKTDWMESLENPMRIIANRFRRLEMSSKSIQVDDSVTDGDIQDIMRHARELFPSLDLSQVNKQKASKCPEYMAWKERHCRERHYTFQIRKCDQPECCLQYSPSTSRAWLPDPVINGSGTHYKPYNEVKNQDTEDSRPSLDLVKDKKEKKRKSTAATPAADKPEEPELEDTENDPNCGHGVSLSTQTAHAVVNCIECRKPRVIYSKQKISSDRQKMAMVLALSEYDYTCGAPHLPAEHTLSGKIVSRSNLTCLAQIEIPYYGAILGPIDICSNCAASGAETDKELKKIYKTVLPLCADCVKIRQPFVAGKYGKK